MKISYNWIKDYLNIDLDPHKVSEILTGIGLEIEGMEEWESVRGGLRGVVIGEVLTCKKHPDADRLSVTTVNTGGSETSSDCVRSSQCGCRTKGPCCFSWDNCF